MKPSDAWLWLRLEQALKDELLAGLLVSNGWFFLEGWRNAINLHLCILRVASSSGRRWLALRTGGKQG